MFKGLLLGRVPDEENPDYMLWLIAKSDGEEKRCGYRINPKDFTTWAQAKKENLLPMKTALKAYFDENSEFQEYENIYSVPYCEKIGY